MNLIDPQVRRLRSWWADRDRHDRAAMLALGALILAGVVLRGAMVLAVRPALLGLPDAFWYIAGAQRDVFLDPLHPAGYSEFLRLVHLLSSNLSLAILIQHALGVGAAVLLFLVVRELAGPTLWALLPAAVLLLGGSEVFLEHAVASESLFIFLQAGAMYAAVRARHRRPVAWALTAGALAGAAVLIRPAGLITAAAVALWLILVTSGRGLRRLVPAVAAVVPVLAIVSAYLIVQQDQKGDTGLVRGSGWYVYGRAAPFADCRKFTPPSGTARLCERKPPSRRPGPTHYVFDPASPAVRAFGNPLGRPGSVDPRPGEFGRAALQGQPLDWLKYVLKEDLPRYVRSDRMLRDDQGPSYEQLILLLAINRDRFTAKAVSEYYTGSQRRREGLLASLHDWERVTRVDRVVSLLGLLLLVAGLVLWRGRRRAVVALPALVAVGGMVGTAVSWGYDARYAIAYQGPAAAAAALGAAALWDRALHARRARLTSRAHA